ncbi:winged helix-turn-helix domain-containing protein [Aliivibrio wodanis]|uniref:winged helix-turn-helix domain-containing protein n=1 Tax=Aliivibrio wodanis TaxID=80852 RepID=UPI00406C10E3
MDKIKFHLNKKNNYIYLNNKKILKINDTEYKILTLLLNNNRIYSKDELLAAAWNKGTYYNSVVPQAISLLRKKLYKHNIDAIITVRSKGYKFNTLIYYKSNSLVIKIKRIINIITRNLNRDKE